MLFDKIFYTTVKWFINFIVYICVPAVPGLIYARLYKIFYHLGIGLLNGGQIDKSVKGIFVGSIMGMFLFHIIFSKIVIKVGKRMCWPKKFLKPIAETLKLDFSNIEFREYVDKIILVGFIWCYLALYILSIDVQLHAIAIYFSLYSLFNSKPQINY